MNEIDMDPFTKAVKSIQMEELLSGADNLVLVVYGAFSNLTVLIVKYPCSMLSHGMMKHLNQTLTIRFSITWTYGRFKP